MVSGRLNFEIRTERLLLRPPVDSDTEALFVLMSDRRLTKFLSWEPHQNMDTTRLLVESLVEAQGSGRGYHWCVCLGEQIVGMVSLIDVRRKIRTWTLDRAELSYWIAGSFQGKGYATEACKHVLRFGFDNLQLHKIIVAHAEENVESRAICSKLGFHLYATEHDAFNKDGKWHNLLWYELIEKDK